MNLFLTCHIIFSSHKRSNLWMVIVDTDLPVVTEAQVSSNTDSFLEQVTKLSIRHEKKEDLSDTWLSQMGCWSQWAQFCCCSSKFLNFLPITVHLLRVRVRSETGWRPRYTNSKPSMITGIKLKAIEQAKSRAFTQRADTPFAVQIIQ